VESEGRGDLLIRGVPQPDCNLTFVLKGVEFRSDLSWRGLGLIGEADGRVKYAGGDRVLWQEKLRQQWFEVELGMTVFRWLHREMCADADAVAARWRSLAALPRVSLWVPPQGLRIIRRPLQVVAPP
jgi:hypothetical protein